MAVDFISSCFSTSTVNSSVTIENYFEDFSIKNSHLHIQLTPKKYNPNFFDKLFLLRFSFYEKIKTSRALCAQDQAFKKSFYSILAIPSLMLDLALNGVLFNSKQMYRLPLISAIGINLVYKKVTQGKNFEYSSGIESLSHTLFNLVGALTVFEIISLAFNALFFNKDPSSINRSFVQMEIPLALFENREDGKITTAFSKARYSSAWKHHSDEQIYELLSETCQKFRYSVREDKIRVYAKWGSHDVEIFVASLKKERSTK